MSIQDIFNFNMYDHSKIENSILDFWKEDETFNKSLAKNKGKKSFVYFEGPPTANGKPGIHHFLGKAFKDLYGRYKTMRGFYVLRRAGWDTHGLPVEIEVEKALGFKSKKDIDSYGIAEFNKKCKESVWKYKKEWEVLTERMGHWIDMDHPYITYSNEYMETNWAIMKKIWEKDLLYKAHRVVPFCVRCGTPLSSHEVAQGYQNIKERSVYLKFKITSVNSVTGDSPTYILAWTTTPWTLPGNIALAVGADIVYVLAEKDGEKLILAKDLVEKVLGEAKVISEIRGKDLVGLEYLPLFEIPELKSSKSYKIYDADFVSTTDGTGVVHTAVMYGEDDYNLGFKIGLPTIHTVDEQGKFKENVGNDLVGMYVKDKKTEDFIVQKLTEAGKLLKTEEYEHDYPFCWRCNTPLLYYAKDSWFIKMSAVNKQLLENNENINWYPEYIKEGRFGQWLREGKDWNISRERYWATPLPIWECSSDNCDHRSVIGSIEEMEKNSIGSGNKYYILRHGLSERKEKTEMIIGTHLENDKYHLVKEGKITAVQSTRELKELGGVDIIFSSPFIRAKETADIVAKEFDLEVTIDERLKEISYGLQTEGQHLENFPSTWGNDFNAKHYGGESWNDERKRVTEFMKDIDTRYKDKKILIVSHGDPLRMMRSIANGDYEKTIYENSEIMQPKWGKLLRLDWRNIPRDDLGELDLHRPYVDQIVLKCTKCGEPMNKIPELFDVWFDSGAMPFAQWHWPHEDGGSLQKQYPADFIVEGVDQTRGWFYTMLAISTLLGKGEPYKNVMCYSHVLDKDGKKMSKSKGNVVSPFDTMEKFGADASRWYFYTVNSPGDSKLYSDKELQTRSQGFLSTLQNCLRFYDLYKQNVGDDKINEKSLLNKWIVSRLNQTIKEVTECLDVYDSMISARLIEKFVSEDFSNWWLRRSRKKKDSLGLLKTLLSEIAKLSAPFVPFMAEEIYQSLNGRRKSVHLEDWPKFDEKLIDENLEKDMAEARDVVTLGLAFRKQNQIKVRQPLQSVTVKRIKPFDIDIEDLIKEELNVKEIKYVQDAELILDVNISPALRDEGYARELVRQIQDMRKELGYKMDDEIFGNWFSEDAELSDAITHWAKIIAEETLIKDFSNVKDDTKTFEAQKEFELAFGKTIWLAIRK